jgi:uncharacterized MAPEG superfamily protein
MNAIEAFAPFAAAVVNCNLAGGDQRWSTILALVFLGARLAHTLVYIGDLDKLRTAVWSVGFGAVVGLFALPLAG